MDDETNGSLSGGPDGDTEVDNSVHACEPGQAVALGDCDNTLSRDCGQESRDVDPEAEQSRQSTSRSSCCSSPPGALFASASQSPPVNRPQEMQPRNIVPPLSPNPSDELGSPGPLTGSAGNNSSFMLAQSPHQHLQQQSQFPVQPYGMPGQMHSSQPQMLQMLQIQQGGGPMLLPPQLTPNGTPIEAYNDDRFLKRRKRCGECGPCKVNKNCDQCKNCLNRKVLKQTCIYRKCIYLRKKEAGGDGDILDYPSPVPPPSADGSGFLPRTNTSGGQSAQPQQVSPTNGTHSSQQQQQQQTVPPSQAQQTQQIQIAGSQQPQQQQQQQQQQQVQIQQNTVVGTNGSLQPNSSSLSQPPPQFIAHGQGFPMQYGGVMTNGFMPGGPMMPSANGPNMANQAIPQMPPQSQLPSGVGFVPNANQQRFVQQQQQAQGQGNMQMPSVNQAPTAQQQAHAQASIALAQQHSQQQQQNSMLSGNIAQFKNTRQVLQATLSDGVDSKPLPGKSFGGQNITSSGGDSLSAILQQQQTRMPNSSVPNGYAGHVAPLVPTSTLTSHPPVPRLVSHQPGGIMFNNNAAMGDPLMNGRLADPYNQSALMNEHLNHHPDQHQHHQMSGYYADASQVHNGGMNVAEYPYNGSENPFCHLKMCGGTGHDQKFLSLISYDFVDPHQAYSPYYHQQPTQQHYMPTNLQHQHQLQQQSHPQDMPSSVYPVYPSSAGPVNGNGSAMMIPHQASASAVNQPHSHSYASTANSVA